jgi:hypothetical protein
MAYLGYALVVVSQELATDQEYELLITGIKSLAEPLEQLRKKNGNLFTGLQFGIRKESKDRSSKYRLDPKKEMVENRNDRELDQPIPKSQTHEERLWERVTRRYN